MASSLTDAFVKAGVISQQTVEQREQAAREKALNEKRAEEEAEQEQHKQEEAAYQEKVAHLKPIQDIWDKSVAAQGFLIHLMKAFPLQSRICLEGGSCCVCYRGLVTPAMVGSSSIDLIRRRLEFEMKHTTELGSSDFQKTYNEFCKGLVKEVIGDYRLGVETPKSEKKMCMPCFHLLQDWMFTNAFKYQKVMSIIGSLPRPRLPGTCIRCQGARVISNQGADVCCPTCGGHG